MRSEDELSPWMDPYASSPWEFHSETLELVLSKRTPDGGKTRRYEVDLERCCSAQEVLGWIFHVAGKTWATDKILAWLIKDLSTYLDSERLCYGPDGGRIDVRETVMRKTGRANVVRDHAAQPDKPNDA